MFTFRLSRCFSTQMKRPQTCYYKVLNVSTQATAKEVKKSYYQLAKKYHPDVIEAQSSSKEKDEMKATFLTV